MARGVLVRALLRGDWVLGALISGSESWFDDAPNTPEEFLCFCFLKAVDTIGNYSK